MGDSFDYSCVKTSNLKQIALAKKALDGYDTDSQDYPSIIKDDDTFKIDTDKDLTYLLYDILQRYYTTADGREKRIARTTRKL